MIIMFLHILYLDSRFSGLALQSTVMVISWSLQIKKDGDDDTLAPVQYVIYVVE